MHLEENYIAVEVVVTGHKRQQLEAVLPLGDQPFLILLSASLPVLLGKEVGTIASFVAKSL